MKMLVFGAGAIGTYVGGALCQTGHNVTFLERPAVVEVLKHQGFTLELPATGGKKAKSTTLELPPDAFTCTSSLQDALAESSFDVAIFALKSFDTAGALEMISPFSTNLPPVLCLSNGVENEAHLAGVLGADRVIAGTVTSSIERRGTGQIVLERRRGMGVAKGHPLAPRLVDALNAAGIKTRLYADAAGMKWSKMLTNLPANASAAILDMSAAEVFAHPGLFHMEMGMLREALAVMKAMRIPVVNLPGVPVKALNLGASLPKRVAHPLMQKAVGGGRGGKMPSFHIDLHAGRGKSEVDWLNGAVVRIGKACGVETPINQVLKDTLLALTRGEIPLTHFSRQPEKLLDLIEQHSKR